MIAGSLSLYMELFRNFLKLNILRFINFAHIFLIAVCDFIMFFIAYGYKNKLIWMYVVFYVSAHIIFVVRTYFSHATD